MRNATLGLAALFLIHGLAHGAVPVGPAPIDPAGWTLAGSYPPASLRGTPQGVVAFQLQVAADGAPTACKVSQPSGAADVDARTCEWLVKHARFHPARDSQGKAVAGHYETRFGWTLKPGGLAPMPQPGSLTMTAIVEADGRITDCQIERSGMPAGGQFDTWCGDLQSYSPQPDSGGKMVRRRLILKRSLSYEELPVGSAKSPSQTPAEDSP